MSQSDRERWNRKYGELGPGAPSVALLLYQGRLTRGRALDVAGGPGENAAILALAGWQVTVFDLSDVAVRRARIRVRELRAEALVVQADALHLPFRGPFETIVVTRFLERAIARELSGLLARGGTIFCEQPTRGIRDDYCVKPGEFPALFPDLETVLEATQGDCAVYVGRRP